MGIFSDREFAIAHCCLNCKHRKYRIEKNVICDVDNKCRSERLVCNKYERTSNENILRQEVKLLPIED